MRGGQHQVSLLLRALEEEGHEPSLLAREDGPLFAAARSDGIETHPVDAKAVWKYSRKADLVHAHDARAHTMAAIASRRKFVVSRRVAFPVKRSVGSLWKYQRATRYLAVSRFVAKQLLSAGVRQEKIDVVYDGVDDRGPACGWNPEYPAVALASRDPEKGRDLVEQAARASGVEVLFSENLTHDLQRASMFVYISRSEGLGSAVLLAMGCGVPVIASRIGGLIETFEEDISGVFVENEVGEIVRAMRKVLGNRVFAQRLIAEGRNRIAQCFSKRHLVEATLASYRKAVDG